MATSDAARAKIAMIAAKRASIDTDIGKAEKRKGQKESEAANRSGRALTTKSASTRKQLEGQAASAQRIVVSEQQKIGGLAKKRADLSKQEAAATRDLNAALKREHALAAREADAERRRQNDERRAAERQRHQDRLSAQSVQSSFGGGSSPGPEARDAVPPLTKPQIEPLRILYGTATPNGELKLGEEIRRVKQAVQASRNSDRIEIQHVSEVTTGGLLDQLSGFRPHVVHFSGHASQDVLVFDDGSPEGAEREVPLELFMRAVSALDNPPKLVVLNACDAGVDLEPLLAAVPMAIGMTAQIGDGDAVTFATRFYRAIADGQSVASALATAMVEMEMNGSPDYELPRLVLAEGVDPALVQLVLENEA